MNEAQLRLTMFSSVNFLLVVTRSTIPCIYTGRPQKWEYTIFAPGRANLAYKMYNNACNLPEHYETYILNISVPAFLSERVPYGELTSEFLNYYLDHKNTAAELTMKI